MKTYSLKNNKGFSLIESIISIAIFAIMSAIVFLILSNALRQREINELAIETKNEQINANVNGSNAPTSYGSFSFSFIKDGGEVAEVEGELAQYGDDTGIFSITKPDLDLSIFEAALLFGSEAEPRNRLPAGRAFYSNLPLDGVGISATILSDNLTEWRITIDYNSVGSGFITYLKVPSNDIKGITNVNNASVHSFTHREGGVATTYIRISKLEFGSNSAEFTVTMGLLDPAYIGLQSWFGSGGAANSVTLVREGDTSIYKPTV